VIKRADREDSTERKETFFCSFRARARADGERKEKTEREGECNPLTLASDTVSLPIPTQFRHVCPAETEELVSCGRGARKSGALGSNIAAAKEREKPDSKKHKREKRSSSCVLLALLEGGAFGNFNPFAFSLSFSFSLSFKTLLTLPPTQTTPHSGRVDATKELDDFSLTASLTDATAKDLDNAPHLRDALVTARTKKDGTNLMVGYDAGQRGALAGLTTATELAGKAVDLGATWFQNGNHVRGEARVQIDDSQSLWATKTLNDDNDVGNATVVNLAERKAFVIEPFNIPVSTAAVKYSIEREGYTVEPAYDLNTKGKEEEGRNFGTFFFFCSLAILTSFLLFLHLYLFRATSPPRRLPVRDQGPRQVHLQAAVRLRRRGRPARGRLRRRQRRRPPAGARVRQGARGPQGLRARAARRHRRQGLGVLRIFEISDDLEKLQEPVV
jgi:hypothetical protein